MKFLRVCKENDFRQGMYRGIGASFANDMLNFDSQKNPMPYDDPGLIKVGDWENKGFLFAFPGVFALKKWIYDPDFYKSLESEGFYPHWIEAEGYHGWYQSVFYPETVASVQQWQWGEI